MCRISILFSNSGYVVGLHTYGVPGISLRKRIIGFILPHKILKRDQIGHCVLIAMKNFGPGDELVAEVGTALRDHSRVAM
jgi:hypothetical protein